MSGHDKPDELFPTLPPPPGGPPPRSTGRPLSADEVDLLKKYRDLAMPAARLAGLDDFAKWLFTSISVVGTLGAAFSTTAMKEFSPLGAILFLIAVFFTGASLFFAVRVRAIEPGGANWQSLTDMLAKSETALKSKQKWATLAGAAFALAVLTAGIAPLLSLAGRPSISNALSYSVGKDGAHASATYSRTAGTIGEIRILATETSKETLVAVQRAAAGSDGTIKLDATGPLPASSTAFRIVIRCDATKDSQQELTVALSRSATVPASAFEKLTPAKGCVE